MVSTGRVRASAAFFALLLWVVMALLVEHLYRLEAGHAAEDLRADTLTRAATADRIRALRRAVARPMHGLDLSGNLDAAIGIAVFPQDGADPESLMHTADKKMYGNKEEPAQGYSEVP